MNKSDSGCAILTFALEISISCNRRWQEYFSGSCASAVRNFSENESITSRRLCGVRVSRKLTKRHGSNAALKNPVWVLRTLQSSVTPDVFRSVHPF
ncbi:MAG: hypothetical protein DME60_11820 [Verrucomicrobia bacterium]|nr:MAG: hypothetical protein DME60_11820 [Verrucomicrobiota bacterium]